MPIKHYVILYNSEDNAITFPIKAVINEYDEKTRQFAGGYPAMFGGNDKGGIDVTLGEETAEESRRTLQVQVPFTMFFDGHTLKDDMYFYWSTAWKRTGQGWRTPASYEEGEMSRIATVQLADLSEVSTDEEVLARLIALSGAPGGSKAQLQKFMDSETAKAFCKFIRDHRR